MIESFKSRLCYGKLLTQNKEQNSMLFKSTDLQELFDCAYNGVIAQNGPSIRNDAHNDTACAYRSHNKNGDVVMCGVGHCLTDEALEEHAHSTIGVSRLITEFDPSHEYNKEMMILLSELQIAHDVANSNFERMGATFISVFKRNMCELAEHKKLIVPLS